jgi:hypothetical protein
MNLSPRNDELLNYADALAAFLNADGLKAETFLRLRPDFMPHFALSDMQGFLRVLWSEHFPLAKAVHLILMMDRGSIHLELRRKKRKQTRKDFSPEDLLVFHYLAAFSFVPITRVCPAQFAIMFLATHPWRARFCPSCGRRFVADKPSRKYCNEVCSHEARKKGKLASWRAHGKTWRTIQKLRAKKRKSR